MIKKVIWFYTINVFFLSLLSCGNSNKEFVPLSFYDNGQVELKCQLIDSLANGECIKYFLSGEIEYIQNHKNGQLSGNAKHFHSNGQLHWEHNYNESGNINGFVQYYDSLGNKYLNANYSESKLKGISHLYFSNGEVMQVANFKEGKREGALFQYFENGKVKYESEYSNGQVVRHTEYNIEGDIVDRLIEFDVQRTGNDEVTIKVLNPMFDRMSLEIFKTSLEKDSVLESIGQYYSDDFIVRIGLEKSFFKEYGLAGIILDIEKISGSNAIVRRRLEFTYPSSPSGGSQTER